MTDKKISVGIVMGSDSDWPTMQAAAVILKEFGIPCEARVLSAHRTPDQALEYSAGAAARGMKALIAGAGGAAASRNTGADACSSSAVKLSSRARRGSDLMPQHSAAAPLAVSARAGSAGQRCRTSMSKACASSS